MAETNNYGSILTNLLGYINEAMILSNDEIKGFIPATTRYSKLEGVSKNETIRLWDVDVGDVGDYEQGMTIPTGKDLSLQITEFKSTAFAIAGEEEKALDNQGFLQSVNYLAFLKAFRKIDAMIERFIAEKVIKNASRACGTIGTVPFGTAGDFDALIQLGLIFDNNGTPVTDRQLILNNIAMSNIRDKMSNLFKFKVNEAGTDSLLKYGILNMPLQNFNIYQSSALGIHEAGTASGTSATKYQATKEYAKGERSLTLDTGSTVIKDGDIVTFAGDTNQYVINKGITGTGDAIELGKPGLMSVCADNTAVTVLGNYTPSVAFQKDTVKVAFRTPFIPSAGDAAIDRTYMVSKWGIPYMISVYGGHGKNVCEVATAYGCEVVQNADVALLIQ